MDSIFLIFNQQFKHIILHKPSISQLLHHLYSRRLDRSLSFKGLIVTFYYRKWFNCCSSPYIIIPDNLHYNMALNIDMSLSYFQLYKSLDSIKSFLHDVHIQEVYLYY